MVMNFQITQNKSHSGKIIQMLHIINHIFIQLNISYQFNYHFQQIYKSYLKIPYYNLSQCRNQILQYILSQMIFILIYVVLQSIKSDIITIDKEFFSNYFNDCDTTAWIISGNNQPTQNYQYNCNGVLIFGGYNNFIGDPQNPVSITRSFGGILPHWSIRIRTTIYKIDSWNNQNLFVTVDNQTQTVYTWNSSFSGTDICGNPNPIIDSLNPSFNDGFVNLDLNISHNSPTLVIVFNTTLSSWLGSWGIRNFQIDIDECDRTCQSCSGPTSLQCLTCDSTIFSSNSIVNGSFKICTCLSGIIVQQILNCINTPCYSCSLPCVLGYYPSSGTCMICNIACKNCIGPTNDVVNCLSCANGFWPNNTGGPCFSCYSTCATCDGPLNTSCNSCNQLFFLVNRSCVTTCPINYFSSQSLRLCIACSANCLSCSGSTLNNCLSCYTNTYLYNFTCASTCPTTLLAYNGNNTCLSNCPSNYFVNSLNYTCMPCSTNCTFCSNLSYCINCNNNSYLLNNACVTNCPSLYYSNTVTGFCDLCYQNCIFCNGSLNNQCLSCANNYYLYNSTCLTSCPNKTYNGVWVCNLCDITCQTCNGPAYNNCLSCPQYTFYQLNYSTCIQNCPASSGVDNTNFYCWDCLSGEVSYLQNCVACDLSCKTCSSTSFEDCLSCNQFRYFSYGECLCNPKRHEDGMQNCRQSQLLNGNFIIKILIYLNLLIAICLEGFFKYKTNILIMIQFMQEVAYTFYISIKYYYEINQILRMLYNSHPSYLIKTQTFSSVHTTGKYAINNKTGDFLYDSGYIYVLTISVLTFFGLLFILKKSFKKDGFSHKIIKLTIKKLNPFLFTTFFTLILMELVLAFTLNITYFEISTVANQFSLFMMLITIFVVLLSLFWKIEDQQGISHYALFYNNEIILPKGDKKSAGLKGLIIFITKLSIPILLPIFNRSPFAQSSILLLLFIAKLIIQLSLQYKRRIYKWTSLLSTLFLIVYSTLLVLSSVGFQMSFGLILTLIIAFVLFLFQTLMQVIINYKLFPAVSKYLYIHLVNQFCVAQEQQE